MNLPERNRLNSGLLNGISAYVLWGVFPIYFHLLRDVPPLIVLCHRIIWSFSFLAILITARREWPHILNAVKQSQTLLLLTAGAILIAINWLVFIYAVGTAQVLQSSMGYFINPVFSVALGLVFLRERLRKWQWVAVGVAVLAVANLAWNQRGLPWIALVLAFSFGLYGLVRKRVHISSLHALTIESAILLPLAAIFLIAKPGSMGGPFFGWLSISGILTATPLLLFGAAVRKLKLSTLGFLQYIGPTLQFLLAVLVFHEKMDPARLVSFILCWAAIAIFVVDSLLSRAPQEVSDEPE